jgi:hypothetical protein
MQPNYQFAGDVVLGFDDRCQNCYMCPLVTYYAKASSKIGVRLKSTD